MSYHSLERGKADRCDGGAPEITRHGTIKDQCFASSSQNTAIIKLEIAGNVTANHTGIQNDRPGVINNSAAAICAKNRINLPAGQPCVKADIDLRITKQDKRSLSLDPQGGKTGKIRCARRGHCTCIGHCDAHDPRAGVTQHTQFLRLVDVQPGKLRVDPAAAAVTTATPHQGKGRSQEPSDTPSHHMGLTREPESIG